MPDSCGSVRSTAQEQVQVSAPALDEEARRRPKTMSRREMLRERRRRERAGEVIEIAEYARPKTRAECSQGPRPCLFVACKHHLYLDVNPETGSIKINFPDRNVWELEETCALDVAERGGVTLEDVGDILNLTRERVRQVEVTGLQKLKGGSVKHELNAFLGWVPVPLVVPPRCLSPLCPGRSSGTRALCPSPSSWSVTTRAPPCPPPWRR